MEHPPGGPSPIPASAPSRKRFALTGRSRAFDPATTAVRRDIADVRLADRVFAPHYAAHVACPLHTPAPISATRDGDPAAQLAAGDIVEVLELTADHAWGVAQASGLVGYVPRAALAGG